MNETRRTIGQAWCAVAALALACCLPAAAGAAQYVVDGAHAKAADTNAGTAEAPLKTITKGVSMAKAGDTVTVKAGLYPEKVTLSGSGTEAAPITLRAAPGQGVSLGGSGAITWAEGAGHWVIDGFQVGGKENTARIGIGSDGAGAHHITIQNCVAVNVGIRMTGCRAMTLRRCIQTGCTRNGVQLRGCKDCEVQECEIFGNGVDGLVLLGGSDGCRVLRNYIHDQWERSHPDGIQIFAGVTNLHVEGNLMFNCGQGFMMEQADSGVFRNNIICGTHHSGLLLGHGNTHNWDIDGNTIAFTAFQALVFTGRGTRIRNNVVVAPPGGKIIRHLGSEPFEADHNLVWEQDGKNQNDKPEGGSPHSKTGDPKFRSAPPLRKKAIFYIDKWADPEAPAKCTAGTLCLGVGPLADHFEVGDHIEVSFDGVARKVTKVTEDSISFDPPLEDTDHLSGQVVVNWKDKRQYVWDLRLAEGSPAKGMGEKGQDAGSSIDMQAYMKGDFNGDGKRDLPPVPKELVE